MGPPWAPLNACGRHLSSGQLPHVSCGRGPANIRECRLVPHHLLLQGVNHQVDLQASPYAMTRDCNFILDRLPGLPEVLLFTGGSGKQHLFVQASSLPCTFRLCAHIHTPFPP